MSLAIFAIKIVSLSMLILDNRDQQGNSCVASQKCTKTSSCTILLVYKLTIYIANCVITAKNLFKLASYTLNAMLLK